MNHFTLKTSGDFLISIIAWAFTISIAAFFLFPLFKFEAIESVFSIFDRYKDNFMWVTALIIALVGLTYMTVKFVHVPEGSEDCGLGKSTLGFVFYVVILILPPVSVACLVIKKVIN